VIESIQLLDQPDDRSRSSRAGMQVASHPRMDKSMSNLELWVARAWVRRGTRRLQLILRRAHATRALLN
jgi:hypothetical protein